MSIAEFGNMFFICFLLPVSCVLFARSLVDIANAGKDDTRKSGGWWNLALSVYLVVYAIAGALLTKPKPMGSWLLAILAVVSVALIIASIQMRRKKPDSRTRMEEKDLLLYAIENPKAVVHVKNLNCSDEKDAEAERAAQYLKEYCLNCGEFSCCDCCFERQDEDGIAACRLDELPANWNV